ncbi:hypothetical protein D3C72_879560 [compost metagenome]
MHQADQLSRDHQPQVATQTIGRKEVLAVQFGVHQCVTLFLIHRFTAVLHGDAQTRFVAALVEGDDDQHFTFIGFLQGVFQQAQQSLAQAGRVAADHPRYLRLDKADQFDVLLFGLGPVDAQAVVDQGIEVELHIVQFDLPGLELGDVENLVDQRQQFVAGAVDGLHVVALLDRQWRAQQQFGHAQHAVHRRADFVADLGEELGFGVDLGIARGEVAADAETTFGDAALTLAEGDAHQQPADTDECHQGHDQTLRRHQCQPQQRGKNDQGADVEHHHCGDEQARRAVTLLPVIEGDKQHAQAGQGHQGIGDDVQRQGVDEQQQQTAGDDKQDVANQQFVQRVRAERREEAIGEHQSCGSGQQQRQIGARGLHRVPVRQPGAGEVEQQQQTEAQQALADRQPQAAARAGVGVAHKVVQQQHGETAEQQAEDQRLIVVGRAHHRRL